jgi:hypothetical protein
MRTRPHSTGYLRALWEFKHMAGIRIEYPRQWLPLLSREHDIYLVSYFQANRLKDKERKFLNMCREFLGATTLSDIT